MKLIEGKQVYSISEVNSLTRQTLEEIELWVEGEIAEFKKNQSYNFYYLTLKDQNAILPAVVDGSVLESLTKDLLGKTVLAYGYLTLYERTGRYQLRIFRLQPLKEGLFQKKLEELIRKLKTEGLFDQKHKKSIPAYPKQVCLVTSEGSDAWRDFKTHSVDKFPIIRLSTVDVRVQGQKSTTQLLKILPYVDKLGFDVIVITRGGGSIEDLAAFNDENVARAIFKMKTPTVVAIGHEANESLAEWVADIRASTPTDAANIITRGYNLVCEKLAGFKYKLKSKVNYFFSTNFQNLDYIYIRLQHTRTSFKDLPHKLKTIHQTLKRQEKYLLFDAIQKTVENFNKLTKASKILFTTNQQKLTNIQKALTLLSPENTLSRGYSITGDVNGKIVRSVNSVEIGSTIGVRLQDGNLTSTVKSKRKNDKRR